MAMRVLIAGGGVAALEAALALRELAEGLVDVELLAPEPRFWYRPLSVAEPFGLGEALHFDLGALASAAGAIFTPGSLVAVDNTRKLAHVSNGGSIEYDVLLIACGALPVEAVPGALTFRGPADTDRMSDLLDEIAAGRARWVAFAVPWGPVWPLPIYELALMTAARVNALGRTDVQLMLVTPEDEPLQLFGSAASAAVRELLDEREVDIHTQRCALEVVGRELRLLGADSLPVDRAVALPRLRGPRIDGIPQTADGFIPTDDHCRVRGVTDVFAAGDVTSFPVKHGGIGAQQADTAAHLIAATAGAEVTATPFRPVLRGLLLTGAEPRYLRHELTGGTGETSVETPQPLWWPPAKIVGRYLAPFLGDLAGAEPQEAARPPGVVPVDVEVDAELASAAARPPVGSAPATLEDGGATVGSAMSTDPLVVAPEDTLGEVAEKMRALDVGAAVVADFGSAIGILTSRDLLRAFAGRAHPSEARVREWMTAEPVTVSVDTPLTTALTLMTEYGFHRLPVVEGRRPVGIIGLRQAARRVRSQPAVGLGF